MIRDYAERYLAQMILEGSEQNVLLGQLGQVLDAGEVTEAAVVVDNDVTLATEANAARHAAYQSKAPGAHVLVYYEKPSIGCDRQLQEVVGGVQRHPARCVGKDHVAV